MWTICWLFFPHGSDGPFCCSVSYLDLLIKTGDSLLFCCITAISHIDSFGRPQFVCRQQCWGSSHHVLLFKKSHELVGIGLRAVPPSMSKPRITNSMGCWCCHLRQIPWHFRWHCHLQFLYPSQCNPFPEEETLEWPLNTHTGQAAMRKATPALGRYAERKFR